MTTPAYMVRASLAHFNSGLSCYIKVSRRYLRPLRLVLPALICSCCHGYIPENDIIAVKSIQVLQDEVPIRSLDIFMFYDGEMTTLDSYQRLEGVSGWEVQTASRKGKRKLFMLANGQWQREDWMTINSYESLNGFKSNLENETSGFPSMSGECITDADGKQTVWVELRSLCSEIVLRSISCDFTGKNYEAIEDLKAYLINVNAECGILEEEDVMPGRIINAGGLDFKDLEKMQEPELLFREGEWLKSGEVLQTGFCFRCYPNNSPEESPGSPFTRLVIEGKIDGQTCYWPINVGRDGSVMTSEGVSRNHRYIYDVTITGKGSGSPDVPAGIETFDSTMEILKWEEKEEYVICY